MRYRALVLPQQRTEPQLQTAIGFVVIVRSKFGGLFPFIAIIIGIIFKAFVL